MDNGYGYILLNLEKRLPVEAFFRKNGVDAFLRDISVLWNTMFANANTIWGTVPNNPKSISILINFWL